MAFDRNLSTRQQVLTLGDSTSKLSANFLDLEDCVRKIHPLGSFYVSWSGVGAFKIKLSIHNISLLRLARLRQGVVDRLALSAPGHLRRAT